MKYPPDTIKAIEERAVLKTATDLGECADMFVAIVKNTSMTGQRVAVGKYIKFPFIFDQNGGLLVALLDSNLLMLIYSKKQMLE